MLWTTPLSPLDITGAIMCVKTVKLCGLCKLLSKKQVSELSSPFWLNDSAIHVTLAVFYFSLAPPSDVLHPSQCFLSFVWNFPVFKILSYKLPYMSHMKILGGKESENYCINLIKHKTYHNKYHSFIENFPDTRQFNKYFPSFLVS